jgi:uncharacterized protein (TIGR02246 family)
MSEDETQIRDLVQHWHRATAAGDIKAVLALMTDDVIFLTAGREPMTKSEFARLSGGPSGTPRPKFEARQEIHEVEVSGSLAFMRSGLSITVTPPGATDCIERAGQTLTVFKKVGERWLLARDANLLVPKSTFSVAAK